MEYFKLQLGCLLIVSYIGFMYFKERNRSLRNESNTIYEIMLVLSVFSLFTDGATAYTVNHLDTVNPTLNLVLHALFLIGIDSLIFALSLYILSMTEGLPKSTKMRLLLYGPFAVNIIAVIYNMDTLEYRTGEVSNYSMGTSAYTCFIMVGVYLFLTLGICIRRWNYIEKHKRNSIFTGIAVLTIVTVYQMLVPEALITSLATTIVIIGCYINKEDPAIYELANYQREMVMGFATLVENRDSNTGNHIRRTEKYVELIAKEMRKRRHEAHVLTKDYMKNLLLAAPMHDIGKIAIPDYILKKPGKLTEEEFERMKTHTTRGGEIIRETFGHMGNVEYVGIAYQIAMYHHEKWNGKGYPEGLRGEEIPLCARIMAIADVFDAVSEDRCYRKALPLEECFEIVRRGGGSDFDPMLADIFMEIRDKVEKVYNDLDD